MDHRLWLGVWRSTGDYYMEMVALRTRESPPTKAFEGKHPWLGIF